MTLAKGMLHKEGHDTSHCAAYVAHALRATPTIAEVVGYMGLPGNQMLRTLTVRVYLRVLAKAFISVYNGSTRYVRMYVLVSLYRNPGLISGFPSKV